MKATVHFYRDRQRDWRWRAVSANGRKIANAGEGYRQLLACQRMATRLFPALTLKTQHQSEPFEL